MRVRRKDADGIVVLSSDHDEDEPVNHKDDFRGDSERMSPTKRKKLLKRSSRKRFTYGEEAAIKHVLREHGYLSNANRPTFIWNRRGSAAQEASPTGSEFWHEHAFKGKFSGRSAESLARHCAKMLRPHPTRTQPRSPKSQLDTTMTSSAPTSKVSIGLAGENAIDCADVAARLNTIPSLILRTLHEVVPASSNRYTANDDAVPPCADLMRASKDRTVHSKEVHEAKECMQSTILLSEQTPFELVASPSSAASELLHADLIPPSSNASSAKAISTFRMDTEDDFNDTALDHAAHIACAELSPSDTLDDFYDASIDFEAHLTCLSTSTA